MKITRLQLRRVLREAISAELFGDPRGRNVSQDNINKALQELRTARSILANSPEFRSSPEHGAVDDVLNRIGNAMMWLTGY
jgi:hypothetical protein